MPKPPPPHTASPAGSAENTDEDALAFAKRMVQWQIKEIEMQPSNDRETAAARARDARTLGELARTLERLDKLERARTGDKRKTKARDDSALKTDLVRKLDQLSQSGKTQCVSGKPQRR